MSRSIQRKRFDFATSTASLLRDLACALRSERRDYTTEPPGRALLLLAAPMMLEMLAQSLLGVAVVLWVSRLGPEAVAVVGLTEAVMGVVYAAAMGIAMAATALIARRIGEHDLDRAAHCAAQVIVTGLGASLGLGCLFGYFAADILTLMGASPAALETGTTYARLMFGANLTAFMMFVINAIFRGAGDVVFSMRTLWIANGLTIALIPCFIFGWGFIPELGLTGAAVATNTGRGVGLIYQAWQLTHGRGRIRIQLSHFRPAPALLRRVVALSSNGVAQLLIATTSWIGLFKLLAVFGTAAVAGFTIAFRISTFALLPALGLASAAATLVGQNLGALQPDRAEAAVRIATRLNTALLALVGAAFAIFSDPIARLFTTDPQVHIHAVHAAFAIGVAFPLYAMGMCLAAAFNGAGDTWTPTWTSFFCLWLGQVPLAWFLAGPLQLGPTGVFIASPASFCVLAVWRYLLFRQGAWKVQNV